MAAAASLMPSSTSTLRVRYAETDKMGVVYYANYLVWFEVARTDLLRAVGWTYREMEHAGVSLPVIESHCEYHRPARYDDEIEIKTDGRMLSAVAHGVPLPRVSTGESGVERVGPDRARGRQSGRAAMPSADARPRGVRVKALVTGVAGFIGSHLAASLLDGGCDGHWRRLFHRLLSAADQGGQPRRERASRRLPLRRGADSGRGLAVTARRGDPRVPPGSPGGRAKELGPVVPVLHRHNVEATQILLEACVGRQLTRFVHASSSSIYGQTQSVPMREDDQPRPISPYGVTKVSAEQLGNLYHQHYGVPVVAMRYFTVYGPRQRPDMAFHRFISARAQGSSPSPCTGMVSRPAISRS